MLILVWNLLLWSSVSWSAVSSSDDSQLVVKTTHGLLRGSYTYTRGGRKIRQFLGIHYAKSPVGQRSFKSPEPVDPWDGVKNATVECDLCTQQFTIVEANRYSVQGSDDCLCINVFVPIIEENKLQKESSHRRLVPCLFFIFGGAFTGFTMKKVYFGPEMWLDKDICLITVSYRLGIVGFLSTEDDVIPGNYGLKDQALALSWVKQNIRNFGGDPDSITVMGQSAGAASTHLHLYSPLTRGLFHRAIMHSGSWNCLWGLAVPGEPTKKAHRLANMLGCSFNSTSAFLECLRSLPSSKIVNLTNKYIESDSDPIAPFNPVIERASVDGAFITVHPKHLSSTKPMLAGYNYAEGMGKVGSLTSGDVEGKFKEWNANINYITPYRLVYYDRAKDLDAVTKKVLRFYFGANNTLIEPSKLTPLVQMCGDFWFIPSVMNAVENHQGPKWFYHFNYNTTVSVCSNIFNNTLYAGACHFDELMYFFPMNITKDNFVNPLNPDYNMSVKMVELWTNFIIHSIPTAENVTWSPVSSYALDYLYITNNGLCMKKNPIEKRRKFWKSLKLIEDSSEEKVVYN